MLKVKFWRLENVVLMRILEQGEEIRRGGGKFFEYKNFILTSAGCPVISNLCLNVRGCHKEDDNKIAICNFETSEEARDYIILATKTIHAYNKSFEEDSTIDDYEIEAVIAE